MRSLVHRGLLALTVATGLAVLGLGGSAAADPMNPTTPEDGLWYFDALGLPEIHNSGITGAGVTIAILDNPINLEVPTLQGANIVVKDSFCRDASGAPLPGTSTDWDVAVHGTEVVSLIVGSGAGYPGGIGVKGVAPGATVLLYPTFYEFDLAPGESCHDESGGSRNDMDALAIEDAVANGAQIISMSFGGGTSLRLEEAIATALRHGVILVAALENKIDSTSSSKTAPGANNGVVSVLSGASDGSLQRTLTDPASANTSDYVDVVAPGVNILAQGGPESKDWTRQTFTHGTSWATPIVAGELALVVQKYPDATANQILQSMIHNTGPTGVSHEATRDVTYGYGTVSARTLLPVDPSQYEDVNPFIDPSITDDDLYGPSVAEIAGTTAPSPGVTPTDPGTTITGPSNLAPLLLVVGIALLLIIAVIVIIVIVAARGKRKGPSHG